MPPLDPEWTEEERELLRSAELDRPPRNGSAKTLAALGIGSMALGGAALSGSAQAAQAAAPGAAGVSATAAAVSGGGKALVIGKWLMLVAVGGAASGAAWHYRNATSNATAPAAVAAPAAKPVPAAAPVVEPQPAEPAAAVEAEAPAAVARVPSATRAEPDLALEIEALDRARRASESHNYGAALAELDQYDRSFKQGRLRQEALLLRVQTLIGKGDAAGARSLGQRFLARYPKSPLAPRIQKLIGAP